MFSKTLLSIIWLVFRVTSAVENWPPPDVIEDIVKPIHDVCTKELHISEDDHEKYDLEKNSPVDLKCYMKCLLREAHWLTSDGTDIDYDHIINDSHPGIKDIVVPAVTHCKPHDQGVDLCERAYNLNICLKEFDSEHWFLP